MEKSMIEYKSIPGASTTSLSFWLSWSFDMVSRASVTKRSRVRISSTPLFSVEYLAPGIRETCAASTLQAQRALVWGGVSIPGASTIILSFWLSWSFDRVYGTMDDSELQLKISREHTLKKGKTKVYWALNQRKLYQNNYIAFHNKIPLKSWSSLLISSKPFKHLLEDWLELHSCSKHAV